MIKKCEICIKAGRERRFSGEKMEKIATDQAKKMYLLVGIYTKCAKNIRETYEMYYKI